MAQAANREGERFLKQSDPKMLVCSGWLLSLESGGRQGPGVSWIFGSESQGLSRQTELSRKLRKEGGCCLKDRPRLVWVRHDQT